MALARLASDQQNLLELLAGPDVTKIGMVCALPPKPLLVRQVAPGGWAEERGVKLGDTVVEVNGIPSTEIVAEDLKKAMAARPLHFRLIVAPISPISVCASPSLAVGPVGAADAVVRLQSAWRGSVSRRRVSASSIQNVHSGDDFRRTKHALRSEEEVLQAEYKQKLQSSNLKDFAPAQVEAAKNIQALFRGHIARKSVASARTEAVADIKGLGDFCQVWKTHKGPEAEAARRIQSAFRGHQARLQFRSLLAKVTAEAPSSADEAAAAIKIQSLVRGFQTRQAVLGSYLDELDEVRFNEAATKIQCVQRGNKARQKVLDVFFAMEAEECGDGVSNDADSTADALSCSHEADTLDAWSYTQDQSRRPSTVTVPNASPFDSREFGPAGRAVPGFTLDSLELESEEQHPLPAEFDELEDEDTVLQPLDDEHFGSDGEESWASDREQSLADTMRSRSEAPACFEAGDNDTAFVEAFKVVLLRKEHGFVRAWRNLLDPSGRGRITFAELCNACRTVGFGGAIKELWRQLDIFDSGGVTLQDLDYDSAESLGRFHGALVARHGSVQKATKVFGLSGARRLQQAEFCSLLRSHGVMRKHEAGALFRTLCTCPPASSLDRDAGISVRDFEWLQNVSKHLPQVDQERVQPGSGANDLGPCGASPEFYDVSTMNEESGDEAESTAGGNTIFEKLYESAMDLKERRRVLAEAPVPEEAHGPVDPHRFERLFNDGKVKREEQEKRTEEFYRSQFPQQGPKQQSPEVWERLNKPKEKELVEEAVIRPERTTCWDLIPFAQIRTACEQTGVDCKGKTRQEMLELLRQIKQNETPKKAPKATPHMERLYASHQKKLEEQEKKRVQAKAKEEEDIQAMQRKPTRGVRKNLHERLHAQAEVTAERRLVLEAEAEARLEASIIQPSRAPANPTTFLRLYADGQTRDANMTEKRRLQEIEEESRIQNTSVHKNKARDPKTFARLYKNARRDDDDEEDSEEEEQPVRQGKGGQRGPPHHEELKGLQRKRTEVENAQRKVISSASDAAHRGVVKQGQSASSSSSAPAKDATASHSAAASKKQNLGAAQRQVKFERDVKPSEAGLLRDFAAFIFSRFPTSDGAADAFDMYKTGAVTIATFSVGTKKFKFQGDAKVVFRALDVDHAGTIGRREFQILNRFHPHAKPDTDGAALRKGPTKAPPAPTSATASSSQKMKSSSNPNLLPRPGESSVQLPSNEGGSGYLYKGHSRIPLPGRKAVYGAPGSEAHSTRPAAKAAPRDDHSSRLAQQLVAESSPYSYKGRSGDAMSGSAAEVGHGKTTPIFGALGMTPATKKQAPFNFAAASRAAEVPLVCDDELLDIQNSDAEEGGSSAWSESRSDDEDGDPWGPSSASCEPAPAEVATASRDAVSNSSSAGSGSSTPRSPDADSMPWQEGSTNISASGVTAPEGEDLQAEVRQLLMQYKLDNEHARSEAGLVQGKAVKETSGPELSSQSAWIHPDILAAQQA